MLSVYSKNADKLIIHEPFEELWSLLRMQGLYIPQPTILKTTNTLPKAINIRGTIQSNHKCYFNKSLDNSFITNLGYELDLSHEYNYEIQWAIKSNDKLTLGFYSPIRKFNNDRLYLNVDNNHKLSVYKNNKGITTLNCNTLVVAVNKYEQNTKISLTITPKHKIINIKPRDSIIIPGCYRVEVFDIKNEGFYYNMIVRKQFKMLYSLVRKYYEYTSIKRNKLLILKDVLPQTIDYNNVLSKESYQSIFTVTTQIEPVTDRRGYYGIVIKRISGTISSATIYYQFSISENIMTTPDVIVTAAYYDTNSGTYSPHQIYDGKQDINVLNIHNGPYPKSNNIIDGYLKLESTAVDIVLLIGNSLFGILPEDGENPDNLIQFTKFEIKYDNVER